MKSILKFPILLHNWTVLPLELDDKILHVDQQREGSAEKIYLWAEAEGFAEPGRMFQLLSTGDPVPENAAHVWTVVTPGKVFHLYEVKRA